MSNNFWETDRIRLRQSEPEDWEIFYEWDLDSEVMRNLYMVMPPQSKERSRQSTLEDAKQPPKDDRYSLIIEERESSMIAGSINTHTTNPRIGIFAYGVAIRPEFQGKGYAKEAILLLLKYFFEELRYQKCTVTIHEWNEASVILHERIGFVKEGQIRRMLYTKGRYWDILYYGLTVEEWREKYGT